jgi:hypothetical protein
VAEMILFKHNMKSTLNNSGSLLLEILRKWVAKMHRWEKCIPGFQKRVFRFLTDLPPRALAFEEFLTHNHLNEPLGKLMLELDRKDFSNLRKIGARARKLIQEGEIPKHIQAAIANNYQQLSRVITWGLPLEAVRPRGSSGGQFCRPA